MRCACACEIANTAASSRTVRFVRRPVHVTTTRRWRGSAHGRPGRHGDRSSRRTTAASCSGREAGQHVEVLHARRMSQARGRIWSWRRRIRNACGVPTTRCPGSAEPRMACRCCGLSVDTNDPVQRRRIEAMFSAAFSLRRAVQRDARARTRAYWAAPRERGRDAAAVRERVGLSRTALEHAAYAHLDAAPHLRRSLTKALAMHVADSVWSATERHLFRDARGERHGMPRVGGWFDFTRIPGRARSHTTERKWETFRLHGSLVGHRAAYARADGVFLQPDRLRPIAAPLGGWWSYLGALAVVVTGLPIGTLVLPVRLPAAPSNQPILDHHLADPSRWHKIDLVRHRDPHAPGGWRYEGAPDGADLLRMSRPRCRRVANWRRSPLRIAVRASTSTSPTSRSHPTPAATICRSRAFSTTPRRGARWPRAPRASGAGTVATIDRGARGIPISTSCHRGNRHTIVGERTPVCRP